jgi:hypothetical protein
MSCKEPRRLYPYNSASVLQYDSGPSPDLLSKILGVDTEQFLFNTLFYFAVPPLGIERPYQSAFRHEDRLC